MATVPSTLARIQEDLKPFADPGTTLQWTGDERTATAEWDSRTQKLSANFSVSSRGDVRVSFRNTALSYQQFLSHPAVADLLGLATMIDQAYKPDIYINTKAQTEEAHPALSLITDLLLEASEKPATSVVFVTGDAGAGKTSVLRELVRTQAQRYRRGETATLYLYVNAQGRALARFDEALAISLQDLRAHLTYGALPTLVRNGLLVPVVDGFDELLGVTGYDDAFASLRRFIDDLSGSGEIVASARSTYYEQEFLQRANAVPQSWTLIPLTVLEWQDTEFNDYLSARYKIETEPSLTQQQFVSGVRACFADATGRALRGKPFFVATAANLVLEGRGVAIGQSLIDHFVGAYVERDRTEKLVDPDGAPLLAREQIEGLFVLLAEEMWFQETRELDLSSVREVAQVFLAEEPLSTSTRERVVQRMPKSAFLMTGGTMNRVQFEHETFLAYFLARSVVPAVLRGPDAARSFLVRGLLPPRCADFAITLIPLQAAQSHLLTTLGEACTTSLQRGAQIRENAGALAAAALRSSGRGAESQHQQQVSLHGFVFAGESFAGIVASHLHLDDVEFRPVDFSLGRLLDSTATDTLFYDVAVDLATTRLEISGVSAADCFVGLRVRDGSSERRVYGTKDVVAALRRVGVPLAASDERGARNIDERVVKIVEDVMQVFERSNVIWPADARHARFRDEPEWVEIRRSLVKFGILVSEIREQRGAQRESLRRNYLPEQVLVGVNIGANVEDPIRHFWEAIERQYPMHGG